jgi:hypothetical protein
MYATTPETQRNHVLLVCSAENALEIPKDWLPWANASRSTNSISEFFRGAFEDFVVSDGVIGVIGRRIAQFSTWRQSREQVRDIIQHIDSTQDAIVVPMDHLFSSVLARFFPRFLRFPRFPRLQRLSIFADRCFLVSRKSNDR